MTALAPKRILVLQSTTQQGFAVCRALAALNVPSSAAPDAPPQVAAPPRFLVLAHVRSATSRRARSLAQLPGVRLVQAPPEDAEMIWAAATTSASEGGEEEQEGEGVWGVFSVQKTYDEPGGVLRETRLGKKVADLAVRHGVGLFVYCSVNFGSIPDRMTGVPQFEAKRLIEEHLEGLEAANPGFNVVVLRPSAFFDNFNPRGGLPARLMVAALRSGVKGSVKMMACSDLGHFASLAFARPDEYVGQRLNLAGDDLTLGEMESQLEEIRGETLPASWAWLGWCVARFSKEAASVIWFLNRHGQTADLAKLRKLHPGLKTWKQYVETEYGKD